MDGRILETECGTFKFKNVWAEDDFGGFREYCEVYEKTGCDDELDPYEYIGDTHFIDLDEATDDELNAILDELIY
jgi:hypothetical protein